MSDTQTPQTVPPVQDAQPPQNAPVQTDPQTTEEVQEYNWIMSVITGNEVNGGIRIKEYDRTTDEPSEEPVNTIEFTATKKANSSVISMVDDNQEISLSYDGKEITADKTDLNTQAMERMDNSAALSAVSTILREHFTDTANGDEDQIAADPLANPYDPEDNPNLSPDTILSSGEDDQDNEGYDKSGDGDGTDPDDYRPDDGYTEEEEVDVKESLEWESE